MINLAKVLKTETCWLWTGARDQHGYGRVGRGGKSLRAHRLSYISKKGPIGNGLFVLHKRNVRHCVNPNHLYLGKQKENARDMMEAGRHPSMLHSNYLPAGDDHWTHRNPSKVKCGAEVHMAKLTESDVKSIRRLLATYLFTLRDIARLFSITPSQVSNIKRFLVWKHLSVEAL